MDEFIGKNRKIISFTEIWNSYKVDFGNGNIWSYPANEIEKHLID